MIETDKAVVRCCGISALVSSYTLLFNPADLDQYRDIQRSLKSIRNSIYQGKTIRVITGAVPNLANHKPYFESVSSITVTQDGVPFYLVQGVDFNYPAYRQGVLGEIYKRWYNIPQWLPMTGCPFCERYCGQVRCP